MNQPGMLATVAATGALLAATAAQADPVSASPVAALATTTEPGADVSPLARWTDRPHLVSIHGAMAGPAGNVGLEVEHTLGTRYLAVALGVGKATGGAQIAGMVRARHLVTNVVAFGAGTGASFGDYEEWLELEGLLDGDHTPNQPERLDNVAWGNGELFVEARSGFGLSIRTFFGVSTILASGRCHDDDHGGLSECATDLPSTLGYGGVAVGWAF